MPPTTFATDIRMLLCEHCGAPLEATIQGGSISCGFCNATNIVQPRLDRFESVPSTQLSESERLARLRMQQGQGCGTRRELKRSGSVEASERLYVLTHVVVDTLLQNQDTVRIRTVLETALESVVLERHRTCLRAMLARHAIREGDLDSARQWLAGCDPRSDNLGSDSEYRLSQALLATARGDPAAVVSILGRDENDIPIAEALADDAAVQATGEEGGIWALIGNLETGEYEFKAAIDGAWDVNYGLGGELNGPNIPLVLDQAFCLFDDFLV